jgi:hypothetical protein
MTTNNKGRAPSQDATPKTSYKRNSTAIRSRAGADAASSSALASSEAEKSGAAS